MNRRFVFVVLTGLTLSFSVFAQGPAPSDIRNLIGARASSGEDGLRRAGFTFVKTTDGGDRKYSNWWGNSRNVCIQVVTMDGRYDNISTVPNADCNRGSNSGGPTWGGGNNQTTTPPSWARGTFYSNNPRVQMTIANNGQVTSIIDGQTYYGRFYNGTIYSNESEATVTHNGNGIRTYNRSTGQTIIFGRNSIGNGNGPIWGGGNDNQTSTPPNWAQGTFYSSNPNVQMTIAQNGQVQSIIDGQTYYGRYYNGSIYSADSQATVTRNGSGIRTYNRTTGQTINFSRSSNGNGPVWGGNNPGGNWGGDKVNVSDLVGARASSGESEMRSRGFRLVDSLQSPPNAIYTIWWRGQSRQCIQIATTNGRYDSVSDIGSHPKCL